MFFTLCVCFAMLECCCTVNGKWFPKDQYYSSRPYNRSITAPGEMIEQKKSQQSNSSTVVSEISFRSRTPNADAGNMNGRRSELLQFRTRIVEGIPYWDDDKDTGRLRAIQ